MSEEKRGKLLLLGALFIAGSGAVHESQRGGSADLPSLGRIAMDSALRRVPPANSAVEEAAGPHLTGRPVHPDFGAVPLDLKDSVVSAPAASSAYSRAAAAAIRLPRGGYSVPDASTPASPEPGAAARAAFGDAVENAPIRRAPFPRSAPQGAKSAQLPVAHSQSLTPSRSVAQTPQERKGGEGVGETPASRLFSSFSFRRTKSRSEAQPAVAAKKRSPRAYRPRKLRPALLSKLLGRGSLKAPPNLPMPKDKPWQSRLIPESLPDGRPVVQAPLSYDLAETAAPPPSCRKTSPHWERRSGSLWLHEKELFGRASQDGWAWARRGPRVWLWPEPQRAPLLRHQGHWWMRSRELWFLVHEGAPWGSQYLREWGQLGFVHPSGAQMIYSADGTKVGMIEPGVGAIVYDARTGRELGRWSADQLPRKPGPSAPASLPPLP